VLRRLSGKARKRSNIEIFQAFATQPDRMHRRLKMGSYFYASPLPSETISDMEGINIQKGQSQ
jgi:hypothetical protein